MRHAAAEFVATAPPLPAAEGAASLTVLQAQARASGGPVRRMRSQGPRCCVRCCVCGDQPTARHARHPLPESLRQLAFAMALSTSR